MAEGNGNGNAKASTWISVAIAIGGVAISFGSVMSQNAAANGVRDQKLTDQERRISVVESNYMDLARKVDQTQRIVQRLADKWNVRTDDIR